MWFAPLFAEVRNTSHSILLSTWMMGYFFAISRGLDFFFLSEWPFWDKLLTLKRCFFLGGDRHVLGLKSGRRFSEHSRDVSWKQHARRQGHGCTMLCSWFTEVDHEKPISKFCELNRGLEFWCNNDKNTVIFNLNPTLERLTGYLELKLRGQFTGYPSRLAHLHERATKRRIRYQLEFYVSELLTSSVPSPEPVVQTDIIQKILRCPDLTKRQTFWQGRWW